RARVIWGGGGASGAWGRGRSATGGPRRASRRARLQPIPAEAPVTSVTATRRSDERFDGGGRPLEGPAGLPLPAPLVPARGAHEGRPAQQGAGQRPRGAAPPAHRPRRVDDQHHALPVAVVDDR